MKKEGKNLLDGLVETILVIIHGGIDELINVVLDVF